VTSDRRERVKRDLAQLTPRQDRALAWLDPSSTL
jgi:hypothetical protein